jgi:hypothetical protein
MSLCTAAQPHPRSYSSDHGTTVAHATALAFRVRSVRVTRWLRRALRRINIDISFRDVVCPEELKTITIDLQWRATVTVRRKMVFLTQPGEGDLRDIVPVDPDAGTASVLLDSPDAIDIGHRPFGANTCIYWRPRDPIVEYAVYAHERSWNTPADEVRDVLCTELACQSKVAVMAIEIVAPVAYETAVAFRLPRWHWLANERQLMKHALVQLEVGRSRPIISESRTRVTWRVSRPRMGDRFVCIAFTATGLAAWRQELADTSLGARLRRLLRIRERGAAATTPGRVLLPWR